MKVINLQVFMVKDPCEGTSCKVNIENDICFYAKDNYNGTGPLSLFGLKCCIDKEVKAMP